VGGEGENGAEGAGDAVGDQEGEIDWRMGLSPQANPFNKDMETNSSMEASEPRTEVAAARNDAHTVSTSTTGICVFHVASACLIGTPAKHAHQNAAILAIKRDATGATTSNIVRQDTGSG